jgi:hypothetical protein
MDREKINAIRARRGGSSGTRAAQAIDVRALARARTKFRSDARAAASKALDAEAIRALGIRLRARKGA